MGWWGVGVVGCWCEGVRMTKLKRIMFFNVNG